MKAQVSPRKLSLSTAVVRALIAAAAVMLTAWTQLLPLSGGSYFANEWLRDSFIRLHASNAPESRIVVIDIDESSLTSVGPWPWPRTRLATLMENLLSVYEARGVALDMVLPERADAEGGMRLALLLVTGAPAYAQTSPAQKDLYLDAIQSISKGQRQDASRTLRYMVQQEPEHAGAWLDLAILQCKLGYAQEAERLFAEIEVRFRPPPGIREIIARQRAQGCAGWQPAGCRSWRDAGSATM